MTRDHRKKSSVDHQLPDWMEATRRIIRKLVGFGALHKLCASRIGPRTNTVYFIHQLNGGWKSQIQTMRNDVKTYRLILLGDEAKKTAARPEINIKIGRR